MNEQHKLILNIVGSPGSGKTTVCAHLEEKYRFVTVRPSDSIRLYAQEHGIPLVRRLDYVMCGQRMKQEDPHIFVKAVLANPAERICVDGLRMPFDMDELRKQGAVMLALECDPIERYERAVMRNTDKNASRLVSFDEFMADEAIDKGHDNPQMPNIEKMIESADYTIETTKLPLADLIIKVDSIIEELLTRKPGDSTSSGSGNTTSQQR